MKCPSCSAEIAPQATFCAGCGRAVDDPFLNTLVNNRYQIEKKIAVGGFGAIYRATQTTTGRKVAIKVMHRELGNDAKLVARFRREGVALCNLRDAHTVTTYELDETPDGRLFIVMELLEGKNLLDVFRSTGLMPWRRVLAVMHSVCSALAEAHALGIVHRDLKPANIYLEERRDKTDFVKVLDFGIAKIMQGSGIDDGSGELTQMGQAVGTLEYMAPEQLMGGRADGRTDIYTLGVVAYEMITGRRPFHAALGTDLLTVQLAEKPIAPSTVVPLLPAVDRVLLKCLEQEPSDRFADVTALSQAIDELLAAAPAATAAPAWAPTRPTPQQAPPVAPPAPESDQKTIPVIDLPVPHTSRQIETAGPDTIRGVDLPGSPDTVRGVDLPVPLDTDRGVELPVPLDTDRQLELQRPLDTIPQVELPVRPPARKSEPPDTMPRLGSEHPPDAGLLRPILIMLVLFVLGIGAGAALAYLL